MRHTRVLIDGMNAAHGLRHALSDLYSTRGRPTGVLFGMLRTIDKLLDTFHPDEISVVWEAGVSWRSSVFPSYKGVRIERIKNMHEQEAEAYGEFMQYQVPDTIVALHKLGIKQVAIPGLEADDVLGHIVRYRRSDDSSWVVVSTDKDMLQLASAQRCRVWNPLKEKLFYQEDKTGELVSNGDVIAPSPRTYLMWRAIEGDTSDSIPGVPGVGAVTVRKLYGNTAWNGEDPKDYLTTVKLKGKRGNTIQDSIDIVRRNIELMELGTLIPVGARTKEANEFMNACQRTKPPLHLPYKIPPFLQDDSDMSPANIYFRIRDFEFAYKPQDWKKWLERHRGLWRRTVHMQTRAWPIPTVDTSIVSKLARGRI